MDLLVDTSVLVGLDRRRKGLDLIFEATGGEAACMASITASELLVGAHHADSPERRKQRESFAEQALLDIPVIPFDLEIARIHAELWATMTKSGTMIGAHDLIIAATARALDYALLTHNVREFERVPGLVVQQPAWT